MLGVMEQTNLITFSASDNAARVKEIFNRYFSGRLAFIKSGNGNLNVKYFGYTAGMVAFRIQSAKKFFDECLIFTKYNEYLIYAYLKFAEKQEDTLYLFRPIKVQIIFSKRRENRRKIEFENESKEVVYISNVLPDFIINNSLALTQKQMDLIKETVVFDLKNLFDYNRIFMINEKANDPRMNYFLEDKTPIVIANLKTKPQKNHEKMFNHYTSHIYPEDFYLSQRKNLISEISVPVLYEALLPYGYIQVNNTTLLTEPGVAGVKRMALILENLIKKNKVFPVSAERLLVSDVSMHGIGIVFNERKFIRNFKDGSQVYLKLLLPEDKGASIVAVVRHIGFMENKIIKIGLEIKEIDDLSRGNYDEYLGALGL